MGEPPEINGSLQNTLKTVLVSFRSLVAQLPSSTTDAAAESGKGLPCTTASNGTADSSGKQRAAMLGSWSLCEAHAGHWLMKSC